MLMTKKEDQIKALEVRKNMLESRGAHNAALVKKALRKIRQLQK